MLCSYNEDFTTSCCFFQLIFRLLSIFLNFLLKKLYFSSFRSFYSFIYYIYSLFLFIYVFKLFFSILLTPFFTFSSYSFSFPSLSHIFSSLLFLLTFSSPLSSHSLSSKLWYTERFLCGRNFLSHKKGCDFSQPPINNLNLNCYKYCHSCNCSYMNRMNCMYLP